MSRWIRVQVGILEHSAFAPEPFTEREAWLWMITKAAWKDTHHRIGSTVVEVPEGSFFTTLREMQAAWKWRSDARVRAFLKRMESERMIERKNNAKKTQITICNYSLYQNPERVENAKITQKERTKYTSTPKNNNITGSSQRRGTRLPDDWMPDEVFARKAGLPSHLIPIEADQFRDYYRAQSGQKGVKLDWQATWRNWVRNAVKRLKARGYSPSGGPKGLLSFG